MKLVTNRVSNVAVKFQLSKKKSGGVHLRFYPASKSENVRNLLEFANLM